MGQTGGKKIIPFLLTFIKSIIKPNLVAQKAKGISHTFFQYQSKQMVFFPLPAVAQYMTPLKKSLFKFSLSEKAILGQGVWEPQTYILKETIDLYEIEVQYRKFLLQHTDSYPTQHQWVIAQSFTASDCLIILHNLIQ